MIYKRDYYVSVGDDHVVITKNPKSSFNHIRGFKRPQQEVSLQRRAEDSNSFWHRNH